MLFETLTLSLHSLPNVSKEYTFYSIFFTHIAGGYREVEIPSPIPNLEVKHFIADNTAGFTCGNVGRCQLLSIFIKLLSI